MLYTGRFILVESVKDRSCNLTAENVIIGLASCKDSKVAWFVQFLSYRLFKSRNLTGGWVNNDIFYFAPQMHHSGRKALMQCSTDTCMQTRHAQSFLKLHCQFCLKNSCTSGAEPRRQLMRILFVQRSRPWDSLSRTSTKFFLSSCMTTNVGTFRSIQDLLELRQYKNDSIQSKIIPTLKLPLFFTT